MLATTITSSNGNQMMTFYPTTNAGGTIYKLYAMIDHPSSINQIKMVHKPDFEDIVTDFHICPRNILSFFHIFTYFIHAYTGPSLLVGPYITLWLIH